MYHFSKVVDASFEDAIDQVTAALKEEGLGVLTVIDVKEAFQKKLGINFRRYKILGACHPKIAYEMLQTDDKAGALYPCNVVVQEHEDGRVEVSAIDPLIMFLTLHSPRAKEIAMEGSERMQAVMDRLGAVAVAG